MIEPTLPVTPDASQARTWAMLCHLSALAGYVIPFGNLIAPVIIWQIKKTEFPEVDAQGKEAVNFQISVMLYGAISLLLTIVLIGIPMLIATVIGSLVLLVVASIRAYHGEAYRYPLTIRFIR